MVSRIVRPKEELVRFVYNPNGDVVPDIHGKLPGKGMWVSAERTSLEIAIKKNILKRNNTAESSVLLNLSDQVTGLLSSSCMNLLGLARKAGKAIYGLNRVLEAVDRGILVTVIIASDSGKSGRSLLTDKIVRNTREIRNIGLFNTMELSLALGGENVVHAGLKSGGLTDRFHNECDRLNGFRVNPQNLTDRAEKLDMS